MSNIVGMFGTEACLSVQTAAMKVQWCVSPITVSPDRLPTFSRHCLLSVNLASISLTRQTHPGCANVSLGAQCLVSLFDSLPGIPSLSTAHSHLKPPASSTKPVHAPTLGLTTLPETETARAHECTMLDVCFLQPSPSSLPQTFLTPSLVMT
jgi:hypothetical protein